MTSAPVSRRSCVVLDIDGVLADVRHRLHHVARRPKDWDAFFAAADNDAVLDTGAELARAAASTHGVVYLTGRPEWLRDATESWLRRHELPTGRLLMRPDGDRRPAMLVKVQQLRKLRREMRVELVVDDDPAVIDTIERAGFNAQLADWMPRHSAVLDDAQEREGRS